MKIEGLFLTMVLPAPNGCNLKCPFCAISARGEAQESALRDEDYIRFLEAVTSNTPVTRLSLQGYEPLLPEVWELTKALFRTADRFDLETGLVTNGTYLAEHAYELSGLADLVAISIDSAEHGIHNRRRGVPGALEQTLEGLRQAARHFGDAISVNSVLFPKRSHDLFGMPKLLQEYGVRDWVISPLIDFRGGCYQLESDELHMALLDLTARAKEYGVDTYLGDELRRFKSDQLYQQLSVAALESTEFVVRLSPDGTCSRGKEILAHSATAPKWDPNEDPYEFLTRILAEYGHALN